MMPRDSSRITTKHTTVFIATYRDEIFLTNYFCGKYRTRKKKVRVGFARSLLRSKEKEYKSILEVSNAKSSKSFVRKISYAKTTVLERYLFTIVFVAVYHVTFFPSLNFFVFYYISQRSSLYSDSLPYDHKSTVFLSKGHSSRSYDSLRFFCIHLRFGT